MLIIMLKITYYKPDETGASNRVQTFSTYTASTPKVRHYGISFDTDVHIVKVEFVNPQTEFSIKTDYRPYHFLSHCHIADVMVDLHGLTLRFHALETKWPPASRKGKGAYAQFLKML